MKSKRRTPPNGWPARWYRGPDIPMRVIRRFARQVAERFRPDKIILFGSYAYGRPHADSDVDILVIMPARNQMGRTHAPARSRHPENSRTSVRAQENAALTSSTTPASTTLGSGKPVGARLPA